MTNYFLYAVEFEIALTQLKTILETHGMLPSVVDKTIATINSLWDTLSKDTTLTEYDKAWLEVKRDATIQRVKDLETRFSK